MTSLPVERLDVVTEMPSEDAQAQIVTMSTEVVVSRAHYYVARYSEIRARRHKIVRRQRHWRRGNSFRRLDSYAAD